MDATEHHFTGKERDTESGNDYFGARYYSSAMGRFMSPDWSAKAEPVPYAKLDDPQSLNLYSYVLNNPLVGIDKDGHECEACAQFMDAVHDLISVKTKMGSGVEGSGSILGLKVGYSAGARIETTHHPFSDKSSTSENVNGTKLEVKIGPLKGELKNPGPSIPGSSGEGQKNGPTAEASLNGPAGSSISNTGEVTLIGGSAGVGPILGGIDVNLNLGALKTAGQNLFPAMVGGAKDLINGAIAPPQTQPNMKRPIIP